MAGKVTGKNLKTRKKQMVTLACRIVHARDKGVCRFCGQSKAKMDASHCLPRSRGWRYAVDTANIILLCSTCHRRWHDEPTWGAAMLRENCPDVAQYIDGLIHPVRPVSVEEAKERLFQLNALAESLGMDAL